MVEEKWNPYLWRDVNIGMFVLMNPQTEILQKKMRNMRKKYIIKIFMRINSK